MQRRDFLSGALAATVATGTVEAQAQVKSKAQANSVSFSPIALSVYDFGAVGDGRTDDTAAIQRCLEAARSTNCRRVLLGSNHVITDLNLAKCYYTGLIIEGTNTTHQPAPDHANLLVRGGSSQGLDISGTSGLVLRNITFAGMAEAPPRCAIFASRIEQSNESYGHIFDNVRCYGSFSCAAVYNHGGEVWTMKQGDYRNDSGRAVLYFTSLNSMGLMSKFFPLDPTVCPLTVTSLRNLTVYGTMRNGAAIWFEQDPAEGSDRTVQQIAIEHCYLVARGRSAATLRFSNITGNVRIVGCTDESFAQSDADAAPTCVQIDGTRVLRGFALQDNVFFPRMAVLEAPAPIQGYRALQNYVWGERRTWRFARLNNALHATLFGNEFFAVTQQAQEVEVVAVDPVTGVSNVSLPDGTVNLAPGLAWPLAPDTGARPQRGGQLLFDAAHERYFVSADPRWDIGAWREAGDRRVEATLPSTGNFAQGQLIWRAAPQPGQSIGWVCVTRGSLGRLNPVAGNIQAGTAVLNVADASGFAVGQYVVCDGMTESAQVVGIASKALTLDRPAARTYRGAVQLSAPVFAEWGAILPV